jgi:hypothetical protein
MGNMPVIYMSFVRPTPGADAEMIERRRRWTTEVYIPMNMKITGVTGYDTYRILKESPEYPSSGSIGHYENPKAWEDSEKSPERIAVREEHDAWEKRGVREGIWAAAYELERSFRKESGSSGDRADTKIENAPIMHLEAYRPTPEEQEKYVKWLSNFGYEFVPLFMKLAGLKGYDFFKDTGHEVMGEVRETEYPAYLSIQYFENLKSFEDYTKSKELVIFQKALRNVFPRGLNYKWYVQYQLAQSWRK